MRLKPDGHGWYHIPFTEYVLPNGARRELLWPTKDSDLAAKATAIITNGFVFEIERLRDGVISATITYRDVGDLAHILSHNDKTLTEKIMKMIADFNILKQTAHVKEMLE